MDFKVSLVLQLHTVVWQNNSFIEIVVTLVFNIGEDLILNLNIIIKKSKYYRLVY